MSLQTIELAVILPSLIVFLLFVVPFPIVSKLVAKLVLSIESIALNGVSLMFLLTVTALGFVLNSYHSWYLKYGGDHREEKFEHLSAKVEYQAKKWLAERNLYIHLIAFVLLAGIMKFARLIREKERLAKEVAAVAEGKKKQ